MTDNNNDVSMDPPTVPGHFSTIRCACRMEKPVHRSTEICMHETRRSSELSADLYGATLYKWRKKRKMMRKQELNDEKAGGWSLYSMF